MKRESVNGGIYFNCAYCGSRQIYKTADPNSGFPYTLCTECGKVIYNCDILHELNKDVIEELGRRLNCKKCCTGYIPLDK